MKEFKAGDLVRVIDDKDGIRELNNHNEIVQLLLPIRLDLINSGMVGTIVEEGINSMYLIDFGVSYKGISPDSGLAEGTCVFINGDLLELVNEQETHNEVEEKNDYDFVLEFKIKGNKGEFSFTKNGKTNTLNGDIDDDQLLRLKMMGSLITMANVLGGLND